MIHPWRVLSFAVLAAMVSFNLRAVAPTDFKMKLPIAVNAAAVGEKSATDLPVLVRLSESIDGFKYSDLASDGSDLAFGVDDGGVITVYPHEIDTWDPEGESLVWVKVPTVAAGTTFNAYYGNGRSGGAAASATWSNYTGVWHFGEAGTDGGTTALKIANATANGSAIDGEAFGGTTGVSGRIGGARRISDASTNSGKAQGEKKGGVWVPGDQDCTKFDGVFTISAWFRHKNQKYYWDHMFHKKTASSANEGGLAVEVSNGGPNVDIYGGNSTKFNVALGMQNEVWHYVTLVFSDTTCTVYKDGEYVNKKANIGKATDSTKRWVFGNDVDGYGGVDGDISWKGLIDEARLSGTAFTADYVALEYAAMATDGFLSFGTPEVQDATMPVFELLSVVRNADNTGFDVSYALKSGSGTLKAVFKDAVTGEVAYEANFVTTSLSVGSTDLAAGKVYDVSIGGTSTAGNPVDKFIGRIYNGAVSVAKVADADEETLTAGRFEVSVATPLAADVEFAYSVGGTAMADETYEALSGKVLIPAGSASAEIEVKPIYNSEVTEDVTVSVDLTGGNNFLLGATSVAELTIANSSDDPYARYVSPSGSSEGTGKRDAPFATIDQALATMDADGGTIWLDDGDYSISETVQLTTPVTIRSMSGDPASVTINKASGNISLFSLNNAGAKLMDVTVSGGGNTKVNGGNVYIDENGGVVEHCILKDGIVSGQYNYGGGNVYMKAGVVSRCIICGGTANYAAGGGGVFMSGGQVESCLIYGNLGGSENGATYAGSAGGGVRLSGTSATLLNCTLYDNRGEMNPGVGIDYDSNAKVLKGRVVNCVIVDNKTMRGTWDYANVGGGKDSAEAFVNCMTDARIAQPNATCFGGYFGFVDRESDDYRLTAGSSAVDAGTSEGVTFYSDLDLDGNPRVSGAGVDVGCFEFSQSQPAVGVSASQDEVLVGTEVSFGAAVFGGAAAGSLTFDFGDGTPHEVSDAQVSHVYATPGPKTVTVVASVGGLDKVGMTVVRVCPTNVYVNASSTGPAAPYATPETAATGLAEALAWATDGTTIKIAAGKYSVSSQLIVNKGIVIEGAAGSPSDVDIHATSACRVFWISHPDAVLRNVCVWDGRPTQTSGGNVYLCDWGGTVSNCVLHTGKADNHSGSGGNLYISAGLATHCVITNGYLTKGGANNKGANVTMTGGRFENSLIAGGRDQATDNAVDTTVAGVRITGGEMVNCTISGNAGRKVGGLSTDGKAIIRNCIIAGNTASAGTSDEAACAGTTDLSCFVNCALDTAEAVNDTCIAGAVGLFIKNAGNGDFHTAPGSPTIDFPGAAVERAPLVDLDGNARIQGKGIDLGCYEYEAGTLAVTFDADLHEGIYPIKVTFTAIVDGAGEGDALTYGWDFNGDGTVDETTDKPVVVHSWDFGGTFTIGLYLNDTTAGTSAQTVKSDFVKLAPQILYVDANSADSVVPYADLAHASTNLMDAIAAAVDGCSIYVAPGVYLNKRRVTVDKSLHIHGISGNRDDVLFCCSGCGAMKVDCVGAFVDSISFTNGWSSSDVDAGISFGVNGGTVSNCASYCAAAQNWNGSGSAVHSPYEGALVTHCKFIGCRLQGDCGGGSKPIVYLNRGRLENSLISGCSDTYAEDGDHVKVITVGAGASVVNCTFVDNDTRDCHVVEVASGGAMVNCVFANNTFTSKIEGDINTGFASEGTDLDAAFVNCATDFGEPLNATCKVGTTETMFKNYEKGDYTPKAGGALYNAGVTPSGWEKITDLASKPRVVGRSVDIGCYEGKAAGFMVYVK